MNMITKYLSPSSTSSSSPSKVDHEQIKDTSSGSASNSNNNRLNPNIQQTNYGSLSSRYDPSSIAAMAEEAEGVGGWMSRACNLGTTAVVSSYNGFKWVFSSTATVGSVVLNKGTDGIVELKRKATKHKDD